MKRYKRTFYQKRLIKRRRQAGTLLALVALALCACTAPLSTVFRFPALLDSGSSVRDMRIVYQLPKATPTAAPVTYDPTQTPVPPKTTPTAAPVTYDPTPTIAPPGEFTPAPIMTDAPPTPTATWTPEPIATAVLTRVMASGMAAVLIIPTPSPVSVQAAENGQLVNGNFELGWHEQGAGELVIPDGWELEYRDGSHPWCPAPCNRPEVKPNEEYVANGQYSMRSFTTFSRGLYAVWQGVSVTPGSWWTFSCKVRVESNPPGELAAFVGIQPWGAGCFERQMVWGQEMQKQLEWQTVSVTAQAYGNRIRVAMGANNKWPTKDNTAWFDECTLKPAEPGSCPACPECPACPPGSGVDYDTIRDIVREELEVRPPVLWPR